MLLALKKDIIYGPVNSRRLGLSLGLNILPSDVKACSFNCVYCQYGWTKLHKLRLNGRKIRLPSAEEVGEALRQTLERLSGSDHFPAYITFSGNGEPAAHSEFDRIVEEVIAIRNLWAPKAKTAILSNSSLVAKEEIRKCLAKLDLPIMKLDCGLPSVFKTYNKPCKGITLEGITRGLVALTKQASVTIQSLFSSGKTGNLSEENINEWLLRLKRIRPASVQIYTLDRGYPSKNLRPATMEELERIRNLCQQEGIPAGVF